MTVSPNAPRPAGLALEAADMLRRIEINYDREGSGPGSRFEGRLVEDVQAEAVVRLLRSRLDAFLAAAETGGTPGRGVLDDLRFELKRGDVYEQHLSSRIEDGLDAQTEAWVAWLGELRRLAGGHGPVAGYIVDGKLWDPADVTVVRQGEERS